MIPLTEATQPELFVCLRLVVKIFFVKLGKQRFHSSTLYNSFISIQFFLSVSQFSK